MSGLAHVTLSMAAAGFPVSGVRSSGDPLDHLVLGLLLGILPGIVLGAFMARLPMGNGTGGGWWRRPRPAPDRPGPLPSGGDAGPAHTSARDSSRPGSVPDYVPTEWAERYQRSPTGSSTVGRTGRAPRSDRLV